MAVTPTGIHGFSLQHQTWRAHLTTQVGRFDLTSLILSLALTMGFPSPRIPRPSSVRLHSCSVAMRVHHGKEEESGHCLRLGTLQPQCRGSIQVAPGNRTTHNLPICHQEHGNRLSTNGTCSCPRLLVPSLAAPWNHMGSGFH